ncbi:MAG: hypothetical protein WBJ37_03330, partial [Bacteroidales bacterium]
MKYSKIIYFLSGVLLLAAIAVSCVSTRPVYDPKDLSYLYNPLKTRINPRYSIFNESDNRSLLGVKFFTGDLFFSEANPAGVPMARMYIYARLYNTTLGRVITDTAYYDIDIVK